MSLSIESRRGPAACWALVLALASCASRAEADADWTLAGRQGIIRLVIVPVEQAGDRAAYDRRIEELCRAQETCFINFFTNSTRAPVTVPLPDSIDREANAVLRRSAKQGVDSFRWSCRLKRPEPNCF